MTTLDLLLKRFATKLFDTERKVAPEDLQYILECARLSCSSVNIQPWKILVVTNPELRAALREASYNQPQVTDAGCLLVLCTVKDAHARLDRTAALIEVGSGAESAAKYVAMAKGSFRPTEQGQLEWLTRQTYLALQAMIIAAAERGLDSCPMEGFQPQRYTEILGLTDVVPTVLLPIGYARAPGLPKVRVPLEDIVEYLT